LTGKLDILKKEAATKAVEFLQSGMTIGLGSGSTARYALDAIGTKIRYDELKSVIGIPSSDKTAAIAQKAGIPLGTLDDFPILDVTIDGADEIDPELNLIKGGGGALLREKILAQNSSRLIIIADQTKLSPALGTNFRLPVEVIPFSLQPMLNYLESIGGIPSLRMGKNGQRFITDEGNLIIDCKFDPISNPFKLAQALKTRSGLVEHGLFPGLATDVIVAGENGIQHIKSKYS
jgi:ribose 5-phosphate isomerase A